MTNMLGMNTAPKYITSDFFSLLPGNARATFQLTALGLHQWHEQVGIHYSLIHDVNLKEEMRAIAHYSMTFDIVAPDGALIASVGASC